VARPHSNLGAPFLALFARGGHETLCTQHRSSKFVYPSRPLTFLARSTHGEYDSPAFPLFADVVRARAMIHGLHGAKHFNSV
jgi:hypothetical protein